MTHLLELVGCAAALVALLIFSSTRKRNSGLPLPPGPRGLPIIGNYKDLPPLGQPEYKHWLKLNDAYGPINSVTILGQPMIALHDKDDIVELLEKSSLKTSDRPSQYFGNELCGLGDFLPSLQYNSEFRHQRKLFHQQLGTKALAARFGDVQDVESWRFLLRVLDNPEGLRDHIKTEASAIMLKITYGYAVEPTKADPLVLLIEYMMAYLGLSFVPLSWMVDIFPILRHLPQGFPGATFQKVAARCKTVIEAVKDAPYDFVRNQMAKGTNRSSLVSSLVQQHIKENDGLSQEDEQSIKLCAGIIYGGGADTTVSILSSMVLAMILYPNVQRKAQKEIDEIIGVGKMPQLGDRERLPYTAALVKESLRWMPVLPIGTTHVTSEEIVYKNYRIPKGSYLMPQIWSCLHDPKVHANPDRFEPERFLAPRNEPDSNLDAFGYGRRICPGRFLAEDSLFLTIARILAVFDISKLKDEEGHEVEFEINVNAGLICRPEPFPYSIGPRSEKHAELIRSVEVEHPWEKADAVLLDSQVHEIGFRVKDEL